MPESAGNADSAALFCFCDRLGRVDKPDPDANARQQHEGCRALDQLVISGGDATSVLGAIEEAFDAVAQGVNSLVDRTLYFTARQDWNHGLAATLLDIPSNGLAVVSRSSSGRRCRRRI
jgi:hypothetical protein